MAIFVCAQGFVSGTLFSDERISVWVFDIGQGDSIFIDAPNAQVLVDGGPTSEVVEKLTSVLPFWDRKLDLIINTHPHADHVTGLVSVLQRYQVKEVWVSGQEYDSDVFEYFEKLGEVEVVGAGAIYNLGAGATLEIVWPEVSVENQIFEDPNDDSLVAILVYNGTRILLTGDIGFEQENQLTEIGDIDILKVGHHGSSSATGSLFLESITPEYSIISVGINNSYNHPSPVTLDRLRLIGSQIFRTDTQGDIHILLDKEGYKVTSFEL